MSAYKNPPSRPDLEGVEEQNELKHIFKRFTSALSPVLMLTKQEHCEYTENTDCCGTHRVFQELVSQHRQIQYVIKYLSSIIIGDTGRRIKAAGSDPVESFLRLGTTQADLVWYDIAQTVMSRLVGVEGSMAYHYYWVVIRDDVYQDLGDGHRTKYYGPYGKINWHV